MSVVSTGTAGSVSRRVDISFKATTVGSASSAEGVIGQDSITLDNNADIRVSIGTNGDVDVSNNANVCGNIRHGVGKKANFGNNGTQCNGYTITSGNVTLPPVSTFMPSRHRDQQLRTTDSSSAFNQQPGGLRAGQLQPRQKPLEHRSVEPDDADDLHLQQRDA